MKFFAFSDLIDPLVMPASCVPVEVFSPLYLPIVAQSHNDVEDGTQKSFYS